MSSPFERPKTKKKKKKIQTSSFDTLKPYKTKTQTNILSHYVLKSTKMLLVFAVDILRKNINDQMPFLDRWIIHV